MDWEKRTQVFYDELAGKHHERMCSKPAELPVDRGMFGVFAELAGWGPVLDVGCGIGVWTAHLADLGCDVRGLDLSTAMLDLARARYPALRFGQASVTALPFDTASVSGVVAYYSLITLPPADRAGAYYELARVLRPGGVLLTGFQIGDDPLEVADPDGSPLSLTYYRQRPDTVEAYLADAGFDVIARTVRAASGTEKTPQAIVLARLHGPGGIAEVDGR